jgi:hypothetical protein
VRWTGIAAVAAVGTASCVVVELSTEVTTEDPFVTEPSLVLVVWNVAAFFGPIIGFVLAGMSRGAAAICTAISVLAVAMTYAMVASTESAFAGFAFVTVPTLLLAVYGIVFGVDAVAHHRRARRR